MIVALDPNPRRCLFCGVPIHRCNGFVLARDAVLILREALAGKPASIKARELCGRCVFVWDAIAERMEAKLDRPA